MSEEALARLEAKVEHLQAQLTVSKLLSEPLMHGLVSDGLVDRSTLAKRLQMLKPHFGADIASGEIPEVFKLGVFATYVDHLIDSISDHTPPSIVP